MSGSLSGPPETDPYHLAKSRARWGLPIIALLPAIPYVLIGLVSAFAGTLELDLLVPSLLAVATIALTVTGILRHKLVLCVVACFLMYGGIALNVLIPKTLG